MKNEMELWFTARPENEGLARMAAAGFLVSADPTLEQIADIKTAISEAVTNSIIHGYGNGEENLVIKEDCKVFMGCYLENKNFTVVIEDKGCGISDIARAMEPLYTTRPDMERSGMGFSFMDTFMDELIVESEIGKGTKITMKKDLAMNDLVVED